MSNETQTAEKQQDKKRQPVTTAVAESTGELASAAELPLMPVTAAGDGSIQTQAGRLDDAQLRTVQRQGMAIQIGRVQGNHHLQRVIRLTARQRRNESKPTVDPPARERSTVQQQAQVIRQSTVTVHRRIQPGDKSVSAIVSDLSDPKIAALAQALDKLADLAQFADGQRGGIKWKKLEGEELERNPHYQEKTPQERDKIVQALAQVRTLIQGLTAAGLGIDPPTLAQVQAHYFNRLNRLTPYYTQMANLDLLYTEKAVKDKKGVVTVKKQKEAWERTCNVTSMAMTLEGLGVKIQDFKGIAALMERIAAHYKVKNVTGLRMPDFLQLVAIYLSFNEKFPDVDLAGHQPDDFTEKVSAARAAAANLVLFSGKFFKFTTLFGVKATIVANPLEKSLTRFGELHQTDQRIARAEKALTDLEKEISRLEASLSSAKDKQKSGIQKRIEAKSKALEQKQKALEQLQAGKQKQIEQYVDSDIKQTEQEIKKLKGKYARLEKTLQKVKASKKPEIEKRMSTVQEQIDDRSTALEKQRAERAGRIAGFEGELEAAAPLDIYRNSVLNPLRNALESGKQVIANRVSHFVRLESLNETEIIIDDPATGGKHSPMTWVDARAQGFFRSYVILEK